MNEFAARYAAFYDVSLAQAEKSIVAILTEIAQTLSYRHTFAYWNQDDIRQEVYCLGIGILEKDGGTFDLSRPLPQYLSHSIRNRLLNLKRDRFLRIEPPCACCDIHDHPKHGCVHFEKWRKRNFAKMALAAPGADSLVESFQSEGEALALVREIEEFVASTFPPKLRSDFHRLKAGVGLPPARRNSVRRAILAKFGEAVAS